MSYTVVGDSLIQNYEYQNIICYPGTTLERFVTQLTIFVDTPHTNLPISKRH